MGLDMYLYAEKHISAWDYEMVEGEMERKDNPVHDLIIGVADMHSLPSGEYGGVTVVKTVAYWRKANAVHGWFVRELAGGVDTCQRIDVSRSDLVRLRDLCVNELYNRNNATPTKRDDVIKLDDESGDTHAKILEAINLEATKTSVAVDDSPLAPVSGFFFGSTERDSWYYNSLEYTADTINSLLANDTENELRFYYEASW
jgi:hypothetical protein